MAEEAADNQWLEAQITDEGLAHMAASIGKKRVLPPWNSEVTKDNIWHFALGIGDDNPLWWDDTYAEASTWKGLVAPPYYILSHTTGPLTAPEHGQMSTAAYLPGVMGVYSGMRIEWRRPVRVGEVLLATAELHDVKVNENGRFGGKTVTQVEKLEVTTDTGEVIADIFYTLKRFERRQTTARGAYLGRELAHYSAEDRRGLDEAYDKEVAQFRRGSEPRYIEDVSVGDTFGPMLKGPLTITNIVGFLMGYGSQMMAANRLHHEQLKRHPSTKVIHPVSGVADQYGGAHWDADLARAAGMPAAYDIGPQRFSWFCHLLTEWAGDDGFLTSLDIRYRLPNFMGDVTWITGEITKVDVDQGLATARLSGANQLGEVHTTAEAIVRLPRRPQ